MKAKPSKVKLPATLAREKKGLSLEVAAKKLRMAPRTLATYEKGRGVSLGKAKRIARLYGCSLFGAFTEQGIAATGQGNARPDAPLPFGKPPEGETS